MTRRRTEPITRSEDDFEGPSKTQIKKELHELQDLGLALLELPDAQLDEFEMNETLREALHDLRRITAHGARRRQVQYVGKLLRSADLEPLRRALAARRAHLARDALAHHEVERWRERVIADDEGLTAWIEAHPASDTRHLRALVRDARRERAAALAAAGRSGGERGNGRAYRELFKHLRTALQPE